MASQAQYVADVNTSVPPGPGAPAASTTTASNSAPVPTTKHHAMVSQQYFQQQEQQQRANDLENLDKSSSNTLKRNPKMELSNTDLLKLLGHLEGELQARDIVIAALKSEKSKFMLNSRYLSSTSDPHAALARDVAIAGSMMGPEGNQIDQQVASLEALIAQQRRMQSRMTKILKDAEIRHRAVIKELEEEKRKHEHDTAQGDDITYGLEKERTRLKKELELEKQEKKRLEMELSKSNDTLEEEKGRQKQIVLLLLAERKRILMKYIEERKRSEDLAQILSEEKIRIDSMAEGLEEESKKSLQMEAELEKQLAQFDMERQQYRQALAKEEKRAKELEMELEKLKSEMEAWKESQGRGLPKGAGVTPPPPPAKPANLVAMPTVRPTVPQTIKAGTVLGTGTPMVSSKVVQPTATVSSVPVSGPTTGIARSVTPGQALRGVAYSPNIPPASGDTTAPSETQVPQGVEKRVAAPPPGTANASGAKHLGTSPAAGKVGYHGSPGQSSTMIPAKKPALSRGVPPPVPPNKPVVPPKKEAAYLRRGDLSATQPPQQQDTLKHPKQLPAQPATASNSVNLSQPTGPNFPQPSDEEAKPR